VRPHYRCRAHRGRPGHHRRPHTAGVGALWAAIVRITGGHATVVTRVVGGRSAAGGHAPLGPRHRYGPVALEGGEEVSPVDLGGERRGEEAPPCPSLDWEGGLRREEVAVTGGEPGDG
jgi:hypothetical protein